MRGLNYCTSYWFSVLFGCLADFLTWDCAISTFTSFRTAAGTTVCRLYLVLCSHRLHNDQRRLIFTVLYCCFSVGWYCTLILLGKSCPKRNVAWFYQCLNSYMFCRCTKLMLAILVTLWCPECLWSPAKVNFISTDVQGFIACKSIVEHLTFYNEAVQEFQFSGSLQLQSLRWHKTCDWLTRKKNQPRGKYILQNGPLE